MIFIAALKNIKKNWLSELFEMIQLLIVVLVVIVMISSTILRYQLYIPFKEYFSSDGLYINYLTTANESPNNQTFSEFVDDEKLIENLDGVEKIASTHGVIGSLTDYPTDNVTLLSYNNEITSNYSPKLSDGEWFDSNSNELQVVISENNHNWSVGDYISIDLFDINEECNTVNAKIIGKIEDGAKVPGYYISENFDNIDFNDFYYPYYYDVMEIPLLMFSYEQLSNYDALQPLQNGTLIQYGSDISEEMIAGNIEKISSYGEIMYSDLKELNANSKKYLYKQAYDLLPIIICLLILIFTSSISDNALSTRRNLKNYAIYYITGLQWKQCVFINLTQSAIISAISFILSFIAILVVKATPFSNDIAIILNSYTILSMIVLIILYIIISMIMPIIIIGKNTPKQILTR